MKNNFRYFLKPALAFVMLVAGIAQSYSQTMVQKPVNVQVHSMIGGYYEALPSDYSANPNKSYPLLVFLHGMGEVGDGSSAQLSKVLYNGPPKLINQGKFPGSFTVNGQTHQFIVISPQLTGRDETGNAIHTLLNHLVAKYRVDQSRIYLTGLSMGGGSVWYYSAMGPNGASRLAAIANMCGNSPPYSGWAATLKNASLPVWAFHNQSDPVCPISYTNDWISQMNALGINPTAKASIFQSSSHDVWTKGYDPLYKENNLNVYEWMLQYTRSGTTTPPPPNQSPVVNAGTDKSITLPVNSVTLTGTGNDADGSIASYQWTKVSGGAATITTPMSASTSVSGLTQGSYTFRLTVTDNKGAISSDDVAVVVHATPATNYVLIPARLEAETAVSYGVQTETTSDAGGGLNVGWIDVGDWMDFSINAPSTGTYTVNFRVASTNGSQLQFRNSTGNTLATVTVPKTGAYQSWQTVSADVSLSAGNQIVRVYASQAGWNLNWISFTQSSTIPPPPPPPPATGTTKVEAESYAAMKGIQTETTSDAGGGLNAGWIDVGDWMDYPLNIAAAGTYKFNFRVASMYGAQLQVRKSDGTVLATVAVPNTGHWQTWQTVSANITLAAGTQTLRIHASQPSWNFNWFDFTATSTTTPTPTPTPTNPTPVSDKIEAEDYITMNGVKTEPTSDAGGGLNVGYVDNGDWMDYTVSTPAQASYVVKFRIASPYWGGEFKVKNSSGTVLATVSVPNTGGYQTWQTVTVPMNLQQGSQTIRIQATVQPWNINWFEISSSTATASTSSSTGAKSGEQTEMLADASNYPVSVFPNPVADKAVVRINNDLTGQMKIQLTDMSGVVKKEMNLTKNSAAVSQIYLATSNLQKGLYLITITMNNWKETIQILKN